MTFKSIARTLHRWLGLASGIIVLIISVSGCIYVFQDEIRDMTEPWRKIPVQEKPLVMPSVLAKAAKELHPELKVTRVVYNSKGRSAFVLISKDKASFTVYVDPYSGKVLKDVDTKTDFFRTVLTLHRYLLLPQEIGRAITGTSIMIFVVLLISGVWIWWPKRRTQFKRSLTIKFNSKWRRLNYDLHSVLGIYAFVILLVIAITGLSFGFEWVRKGIYNAGNLGKSFPMEDKVLHSDPEKKMKLDSLIDLAFSQGLKHSPDAEMFYIQMPRKKEKALTVTAYAYSRIFYKSDRFYFDMGTGALFKTLKDGDKSTGLKLNEANYDIHTGQIFGFTGKLIVFFCGLISASLPITGFIFWLNARKDKIGSRKDKKRKHFRNVSVN